MTVDLSTAKAGQTKETGGSAFPCEGPKTVKNEQGHFYIIDHSGMTLRDYFAGQALTGLLACGAEIHGVDKGFSEVAYKHADFMIEARKP